MPQGTLLFVILLWVGGLGGGGAHVISSYTSASPVPEELW